MILYAQNAQEFIEKFSKEFEKVMNNNIGIFRSS
jgi:hypothetical protein